MQVFATAEFAKFASKQNISDAALCEAVARAERGLIDADLAGALIKQRVARPGQGRSGGYRVILAFRSGQRAIFLYGFPKNVKANLSPAEEESYREFADLVLDLPDKGLEAAVKQRKWRRIDCEQDQAEVPE